MAGARRAWLRRTEPSLVPCAGCGSEFRAAYTGGRCPICDRPAVEEAQQAGRLARVRRALGDRWVSGLLVVAIAGNVVIFVLVAIAASR